jgi:hypothetical protein
MFVLLNIVRRFRCRRCSRLCVLHLGRLIVATICILKSDLGIGAGAGLVGGLDLGLMCGDGIRTTGMECSVNSTLAVATIIKQCRVWWHTSRETIEIRQESARANKPIGARVGRIATNAGDPSALLCVATGPLLSVEGIK